MEVNWKVVEENPGLPRAVARACRNSWSGLVGQEDAVSMARIAIARAATLYDGAMGRPGGLIAFVAYKARYILIDMVRKEFGTRRPCTIRHAMGRMRRLEPESFRRSRHSKLMMQPGRDYREPTQAFDDADEIEVALASLSPRHRDAILRVYGIGGRRGEKQQDVAAQLGVAPASVSLWISRGLMEARSRLERVPVQRVQVDRVGSRHRRQRAEERRVPDK